MNLFIQVIHFMLTQNYIDIYHTEVWQSIRCAHVRKKNHHIEALLFTLCSRKHHDTLHDKVKNYHNMIDEIYSERRMNEFFSKDELSKVL